MRDDPLVIAMVNRAFAGDQGAWNKIVERYSPLMWSTCLRYRLDRQDSDDVGQSGWLLLVERIGMLREPAALPGWSATLDMRVGGIGPMRARCLDRLRQSPHIAAIADGARDKQARGERGD